MSLFIDGVDAYWQGVRDGASGRVRPLDENGLMPPPRVMPPSGSCCVSCPGYDQPDCCARTSQQGRITSSGTYIEYGPPVAEPDEPDDTPRRRWAPWRR